MIKKNKKKILYIDLFSGYGHINLNKTYIYKFKELGYDLNFVVKEGYDIQLGIDKEKLFWLIPNNYFENKFGKVGVRCNIYKMLNHIKKNINTSEYDLLFFSYFDEIPFSFFNFNCKVILMNHSNIAGLNNLIKLFFLKKVSKFSRILVFHESIKRQFCHYGIDNVVVQPLGLIKVETDRNNIGNKIINLDFEKKVNFDYYNLKIFIPNLKKDGKKSLFDIIQSSDFCTFLHQNKVLLMFKSESELVYCENFLLLDSILSKELYNYVFEKSDLVILDYPSSFEFKVSAALFECFSFNKYVLLSNISSFKYFKEFFNYNPFYNNYEELKKNILDAIVFNNLSKNKKIFNNIDLLNPNLKSLF